MLGGLLSSWQSPAASSGSRSRKGSVSNTENPDGEDNTTVLDEEQGSIIISMISQLRIGMDLNKVIFPTFVLEPRSMLERITDFMSHPDLVFGADEIADPEERFIRVLIYYLSGWHVMPKGVKKPYNPVLGEFFRCRYDYPDGTHGYYIAEQVSHHPPISAYFYHSPANHLRISGELKPKSKFLGNSLSTSMEGQNRVFFTKRPQDGEYVITMPNMYARGILFGQMVLELGETSTGTNEKTGMSCSVEFKTKGYFSGIYNAISGKVKNGLIDIGEISGRWSHQMEFTSSRTGEKRVLFDAETAKMVPKVVQPETEQEPNESRRLWSKLTEAIKNKDMDAATAAKSAVEDAQRESARRREQFGVKHEPRFFRMEIDGRWVPKAHFPDDPVEAEKAVKEWIWNHRPSSIIEEHHNG